MAVRTIFLMAEECSRGERQGWQEFVHDFAPLAATLLRRYFPFLALELQANVATVFQRARANDHAWFRNLRFSNEREFLMGFRKLLFAHGREASAATQPELSLEQMREIIASLSLVEREALWLLMRGYDAPETAAILANASATAEAVKSVVQERLPKILSGTAAALSEAAEKTATPECLDLKTFNNLINGQVTWRERELAEQHIRDCFNCLDRFTTFQEMIRLRKDTAPLPEAEVERFLQMAGIALAKPKGLWDRLRSRRAG